MRERKRVFELIKKNLINKGAIHIIVGSFITKFVSFFGSIFLVRILSKQDYGVLSYYENFLSYFIILAGFGLAVGIQRYIILADTIEEKKTCYINALQIGNVWNIGLIVIALTFFLFYPHPDAFKDCFSIALMLTLCIPAIYILNASLSTLRAMFEYKGYAVMAFISSFFLIVMRIIGAAINGIAGTVLFRLLCEIICACICLLYVYFKFFNNVSAGVLKKTFVKERNIYSIQMMFTNGLWAIFMLNDLFLLGQLIGNEVLIADYKVAYVIPANLSILTAAVGIFVSPYFTKKEKENDWNWIGKKCKLVLTATIVTMGVCSLLCFAMAKPLIVLMYGEQYISAVPIMRLLLVASFLNNGIRATIANIFSSIGFQKINLIVAVIGMAIQIILDIILIPLYGGFGVACSSAIVYLIMSTVLIVIFLRMIKNRGEGHE